MTDSRCNSPLRAYRWRSLRGAAALGALLVAPVAAFALSTGEPTPIGLPPGQPGEQPAEQPATPPAQDTSTGGIGSAPLPPLPQPQEPQTPPADPAVGAATPQPDPSAPQAAPAAAEPGAATPNAATPSAAGLLDDSNAGLGSNIWQGSSGAKL